MCNSRDKRQFSDLPYFPGLPIQAVSADMMKLQCCNKHFCAGGGGRLQRWDNGIRLPLCFSGDPGIYMNMLTLH